ncbi:NAD-dependent malic enzyme [bacterium]|nr:NAD-dependent malic enzyme [bacterium]
MSKDLKEQALEYHAMGKPGKIEIVPTKPHSTQTDLGLAYTPGVAAPCLEIKDDPDKAYLYTRKWNMVAVITDGSAVLGLGNIGPLAGLPVMEGKSVLFKSFGNVDAFPICVNTQNVEEFIATVKNISLVFGGINLEDISAPRCFEIEDRLINELDIPVFHDDQHGTAVVTLAALYNALKIAGKELEDLKIVINGVGAAGTAIARLLYANGARDFTLLNTKGIISKEHMTLDPKRAELLDFAVRDKGTGGLEEAVKGADLFIGVSAPNILKPEMVNTMAKDPMIFACANPTPEIDPDLAKEAGALVVCTGRSDYPNQVNNVLAFPGIFRGALDARAKKITEEMKLAAAQAIANMVSPDELKPDYVIPPALDREVTRAVAEAVYCAAKGNVI